MALRFEDDFLKKLEYLHVVSKRAFAGQSRADRLAPKRGTGMEFADHRGYSPGDDFRHIDWKAYKRLGRLLLRLFDEEQDLPIYLMLDTSSSMAESAKFDQALRVTAAICYIGLSHLDRIEIVSFTDRLGHEETPGMGKGRIFRVFEMLEKMKADGKTNLRVSINDFAAHGRRRGLVAVISDFLDVDGSETGLKILRTLGHDVFAVHMVSEADREVSAYGDVRFVDSETGERRDIEITPRLAAAYQAAWQAHTDAIESFCGRYDIGYVRADAERPFDEIILQAFRQGRFLA